MNCSNVIMNDFIECLLTSDYEKLGGQEAWEELYSEYIGLRENKSSSYVLSIIKEITYLQTKVFIIVKCCEVLAVVYSRELVNEIKQCGCKGRFDWSNKDQYSNDVKAAVSYSKKYITQYQKKEKELADYNTRHGNIAIQRKDFDIWAVTLSKFIGFRVDYNVVYVSEYCHMMNMYERYCEVSHAEENPIKAKNIR